jgi:hypothetical protein
MKPRRLEKYDKVLNMRTKSIRVVLENIAAPVNTATILRTVEVMPSCCAIFDAYYPPVGFWYSKYRYCAKL